MATAFAPSKLVYQELRSAIAPWARRAGYRRWSGTQAGWQRAVRPGQLLRFKFEGYSQVNPDIGGSLSGLVQLESSSEGAADLLRQSPFSCCVSPAELGRLADIQGTINRKRPPLPQYLASDAQSDSVLGHRLRELYAPSPQYREGQPVSLSYYSIDDVRELVGFLAAVLPRALERFLEGRVATPIDTTPPHLRPQWLEGS
jgi:hypothetical protein